MSFKDTFTRDNESQRQLQYDETAFSFFMISICTTIMVPLSYSILKQIFYNPAKIYLRENYQTEQEIAKANRIYERNKLKYFNFTFFIKVLVVIAMLKFTVSTYNNIQQTPTLKRFDPYEILDIDPGATVQEIKKAFRKMSLIWHPDRNDSPDAPAMFIMLTKAHECLTDETKKAICEKYGNPDGQGAIQVAIALPPFLLKKENRLGILAIFFLVLLVIIPSVVYNWYIESTKFDEQGVFSENRRILYFYCNENTTVKLIPDILAQAIEFQNMPVKQQEAKELQKIENEIKETFNQRLNIKNIRSAKAYNLICAHLLGMKISPIFDKEFNYIIGLCPKLAQSLINNFTQSRELMNREYNKMVIKYSGKNIKFIGSRVILHLIEFQQQVTQGIHWKDSPFYQMESFNSDLRRVKRTDFYEMVNKSSSERKINFIQNDKQRQFFEQELDFYPKVEVSHRVFVAEVEENQDLLTEADLITLEVAIKIKNPRKKFAYAPKFPEFKTENWHIVISSSNDDLMFYKLVQPTTGDNKYDFKLRLPKNKYEWELNVKSDSYFGLDEQITIKFEVLDGKLAQTEIKYHEEDEMNQNNPSLMEMMQSQLKRNNDSDEEEEEEEEEKAEVQESKKNPKAKKSPAKKDDREQEEHEEEEEEQNEELEPESEEDEDKKTK